MRNPKEVRIRRIVVLLAVLVISALVAPAALAKGALDATISGPGLDRPITLAGDDQQLLMTIAEKAGFLPAVFAWTPDPVLDRQPPGTLGQKYTVRYTMPGPNNEQGTLVQELFPYASPSPVTYVQPGQRFWTTEETRGGWFVATEELRSLLVAAGLPETAPTADTMPPDTRWTVLGPLAALVAVAAIGSVGVARLLRRRPRTA